MDEQFWQARWAENQIGFHQRETNPYLERYWLRLQLPAGCKVLVPLCGKTLDMLWLAGQGHRVLANHYEEMLRRNYIAAPCAVMWRRGVFEALAGFNPAFSVTADYELYLRALREFPAWSHGQEVAEYRRHGLGLSGDAGQILREALDALRAERPYLAGRPALTGAYRSGIRYWKTLTAEAMARQVREDWANGCWRSVVRGLLDLGRCGWLGLAPLTRRGHAGVRA